MKRIRLFFYFCAGGLILACAKQPEYSVTPRLEYKELSFRQVLRNNQYRDTCDFIIGFSDADGDLFVENENDPSNVILRYYVFNSDSSKFLVSGVESKKLKEPANGYYRGKAISGEIQIPLTQFRPSNAYKIIKMELQMTDLKNHVSNLVTSPVFTLDF
jgi:hypothetical protein